MSPKGEDGTLFQSGDRCPLPSQRQQDTASRRGSHSSRSRSQQIQSPIDPTPSLEFDSNLDQEGELPYYTPYSRTEQHLQSDCKPPSQLGESLSHTSLPDQKSDRLLQVSNNSHTQDDINLAGAQCPASADDKASAASTQEISTSVKTKTFEEEYPQLAESICHFVAKRFPLNFVTVSTKDDIHEKFEVLFQYILTDLRSHFSHRLHYWPTELRDGPCDDEEASKWDYQDWVVYIGNAIAYRLWENPIPEPIDFAPSEPDDEELPFEDEGNVARRQIEDFAFEAGFNYHWRLTCSLSSFELPTPPSEASSDSFVTACSEIGTIQSAGSHLDITESDTGPSACLATSAGTFNDASASSPNDTLANGPFHHSPALENDPEEDGIYGRDVGEYIASGQGNPTFRCILNSCHFRIDNRVDLDKHMLRKHQDVFQGIEMPMPHNQLNADALEVYFGGRVPPFAQKYFIGAFRTAVLSSRAPMTIPRAREEDERSSVTIDTFGIPLKGDRTLMG